MLPVQRQGILAGYIAALTPLGQVDASIAAFRFMVLILGLAGLTAALAGGWLIAGKAMRPCALMLETAEVIASARDLSRRIDVPPSRDELSRLAQTLNRMLDSVETAYCAQQRFVADASHELRAPLTAIQANRELLQRHPEMSAADHVEALAEAERESSRLSRLVADMLALARADAGVPLKHAPVDLDSVVLEAADSTRPLGRGHAITCGAFARIKVQRDEDRLKQMLMILLDNALKYTPAGGTVAVGLRVTREGTQTWRS